MSDRGKVTASSIARMAGNIASGLLMKKAAYYDMYEHELKTIATVSVKLAYLINAEVDHLGPGEGSQ